MQTTRMCHIERCPNSYHGRGMCRAHYMEWWRNTRDEPTYDEPAQPSKRDRFLSKIDRESSEYGCWIWTASRYKNGYSQFGHEPGHRYSHREFVGEIPEGYHIDHLCMNHACVNPDHLEAVTAQENVLRGYGPNVAAARTTAKANARTHCANGHAMTAENTYRAPGTPTWRACRACRKDRDTKRKIRIKETRNVQC